VIKSRRRRWAGLVACMGEMRNAYKLVIEKPEQRPLGRPRRIMGDMEMGWIHLAQVRDY
jgi:hypothetical protein